MSYILGQADALRIPLPDRSVDLVVGSPPYCDARTYGIGAQRDARGWVEWMLRVTAEALRVSKGAVIWVAAGVTRDRTYWPACEGLSWRWFDEGWTERGPGTAGEGSAYRPVYWHRVGIPGSGGDDWFRADVEFCMNFKRPGPLPWSDNTACGEPPKFNNSGGAPTHRLANGDRVKAYKRGRRANGHRIDREPSGGAAGTTISVGIANPGNLIHTKVGGGHLGHALAHENEAPFDVRVPEFFIRSLCPPGGLCLDPFSGSGTTCEAALKHGRRAIGLDLRRSQAAIARQRLDHPHAPVVKRHKGDRPMPLLEPLEAS